MEESKLSRGKATRPGSRSVGWRPGREVLSGPESCRSYRLRGRCAARIEGGRGRRTRCVSSTLPSFEGKEERFTARTKSQSGQRTRGVCYLIPPAVSPIHKAGCGLSRLAGVKLSHLSANTTRGLPAGRPAQRSACRVRFLTLVHMYPSSRTFISLASYRSHTTISPR